MPRPSKGPRLYLRRGRVKNGKPVGDTWVILDGTREVSTGYGAGSLGEAERQLADYISTKWSAPTEGRSDPTAVTVADVLALYARERGSSLRSDDATMLGFTRHLLTFWSGKTLSDVRRLTCQDYVTSRTAQAIRHGATGRKISVSTARRELEVLSAAIGFWDDEYHLTRRPKVVLPEKPESKRDALTRQEAARLLWASLGHRIEQGRSTALSGSAKANRAHMRRFILISLYTGSRAGVTKRLLWTESPAAPWVDLDAGVIYRRGRDEREARTKRKPLVKLPRRLISHLKRWKAVDEAKGINAVIHHGGVPIVSVRKGMAGCASDAGLSGVTAHWFRHTCPTWLMERGVDIWEAAGFVGMSATTLEKHYGHHRPDHQSAARKALG